MELKKNILVTGGRAPVTLDLGRLLKNHNHGKLIVADSLKYFLSQASAVFSEKYSIRPPNPNSQNFADDLIAIIKKENIDFLIPTCEEVFFISKHKDAISRHCTVFCDDLAKMLKLHHKSTFIEQAEDCTVSLPQTFTVNSQREIEKFLPKSHDWVFKPAYSRFAENALLRPNREVLRHLNFNPKNPWVAQEFIDGTELCSYSIAINGKITAHQTYIPQYKVGLGAGMYFEICANKKIDNFVKNFVEKHNYTGHIGFDFIQKNNDQMYVIECNPRATSGIHFIDKDFDILQALTTENSKAYVSKNDKPPLMIGSAFIFIGLSKYFFKKPLKYISAWIRASDVTGTVRDWKPLFFQYFVFLHLMYQSLKTGKTLQECSSVDVEWNGE